MASDTWGSVQGDGDAKLIVSGRSRELSTLAITVSVFFLILLGVAVWYAITGSHAALAVEVVVAAICAAGWVRKELFVTHSYVMVAERRIQLVEQQIQAMRDERC